MSLKEHIIKLGSQIIVVLFFIAPILLALKVISIITTYQVGAP